MKRTLTIELEDFEDSIDGYSRTEVFLKAEAYRDALNELDRTLRNKLKYQDSKYTKAQLKVIQEIRDELCVIVNDLTITI